ncbi:MAG: cysteine-rich CWC family protein [Gammaproteobacteria bacterium]|nr:cysteine-rich CWC family protein [Gammaproteobacteria bacterium]
MLKNLDDTLCPFCQSKNQCMAHVEKNCWCDTANVPKELLAIVPEETQNKVCICLSCIQLFKESPKDFIKKYTSFRE